MLSPDALWVLTETQDQPQRLTLLPTGPGEPRSLPDAGFRYQATAWFPDGKRIAFGASAPGHGVRLYAQDVAGGPPVPFTAEGIGLSRPWLAISPDGKWAAATGEGQRPFLFPTKGGDPVALPWLEPEDTPQRFSADGRLLYCMRSGMSTGAIVRADLEAKTRTVWETIRPMDVAGVFGVSAVTGEGIPEFRRALFSLVPQPDEVVVGEDGEDEERHHHRGDDDPDDHEVDTRSRGSRRDGRR